MHTKVSAKDFEFMNVPYRLPAPATEIGGQGFQHLKHRLASALLPDIFKPTGLEQLDNASFEALTHSRDIFPHAGSLKTLLTKSWSGMIAEDGLTDPTSKGFRDYLRSHLKGKKLIELGAGSNGAMHARIFRTLFGVSGYTPVDMQDLVKESGGIQSDALSYLQQCKDDSANIVAFGLFNEPMSPLFATSPAHFMWPARMPEVSTRRQCEQEYLRRLAGEISRVLPRNGFLFGDGLRPLKTCRDLELYLQGNGIKHEGAGYAALFHASEAIKIGDPFFMVKR